MAGKEDVSFSTRLIEALSRYRKPLIWGMAILVVALIATFAYLEVQQRRAEEALTRVEEAEDLYQSWVDALEDDDSAAAEDIRVELETITQEVLAKYPRKYAANRARFLQGEIYRQLEDWVSAGEAYRETAETFPRSHLASVSLYNAGAAFEEAGELDSATESFQEIEDRFGESPSPLVPQAVFSLGRIAEENGDFAGAEEHYQRLVENHPGSSWTSLARSRIILLTAEGRIN
ncbi:MAG: tetratricopeptide repeat protein [Spirochaetaceae bacterium]